MGERFAIHAARTQRELWEFSSSDIGWVLSGDLGPGWRELVPRGAIVATVRLVRVVRFPDPAYPPDRFGDFSDGRWGWVLDDVRRLDPPVPARGLRRLWFWTPPQEEG